MNTMIPEMAALKSRLRAMWMLGDYAEFAKYLEPGALEFLARLQIAPGTRVLDVACGAGQVTLPMARAGALVTGIDIAANLIDKARARAVQENLAIRFDEGDTEELPYADASFELVISLIGAMFAPQPERVAAELARVCKPGGRLAMANWTPDGFIGQLFKLNARFLPPPAHVPAPVLWGDPLTVSQRLGADFSNLQLTKRMYPFQYPFPPSKVVEFWRTYYGPTHRTFAALNAPEQDLLRREFETLLAAHNRASEGMTCFESEYLQVIATRAKK